MAKMNKNDVRKMQISRIEKEIRDTPYHKGTEHHIGRLRARLSKLKSDGIGEQSRKSGGGGGYAVKKQGDATIVLVGPPSVGKSTLINSITNAKSKIAPYAFTTVTVIPGMMKYRDAHIQVLDVPGLIEGAEEGKGRGREVLSVVRGADLVVIITDISKIKSVEKIKDALERNGIRLDKSAPSVSIDKKLKGGLNVYTNIKQDISFETIKSVAEEFGIKNADITIKEKLDMDSLIDSFARNRVYVPTITLVNKVDLKKNLHIPSGFVAMSAEKGEGIDEFKEKLWEKLSLMRVYLVRRDEEPSTKNPLILKKHIKLAEIAQKIGPEFAEEINQARIWGPGAKFPGQIVSLSKISEEGMMIRFI